MKTRRQNQVLFKKKITCHLVTFAFLQEHREKIKRNKKKPRQNQSYGRVEEIFKWMSQWF